MGSETEDAELAAGRLEAALERIARLAASGDRPGTGDPAASVETTELAHRLDAMIERLRAALNGKS